MCTLRRGVAAANRSGRDVLQRLIDTTLADAAACTPAVPRVVPLPRHGRLVVRVIGALTDILAAGAGLASGLALAAPRHESAFAHAALTRYNALLNLPLRAPPNQHATIVSRGFAPGGETGFHLHRCGHEIVCVLEGSLTMEYVGQPTTQTGAGEAIYVAPGVIHRGVNANTNALSLFHVGIGPAGSIDRRNI